MKFKVFTFVLCLFVLIFPLSASADSFGVSKLPELPEHSDYFVFYNDDGSIQCDCFVIPVSNGLFSSDRLTFDYDHYVNGDNCKEYVLQNNSWVALPPPGTGSYTIFYSNFNLDNILFSSFNIFNSDKEILYYSNPYNAQMAYSKINSSFISSFKILNPFISSFTSIVPIILPVVIGCLAFRKGFVFIRSVIRGV